MADIWASRVLDMRTPYDVPEGYLIGVDPTHIQVGLAEPWVAHFRGTFSSDADGIHGVLNSFTATYNGRTVLRITGLDLDAHVVANYLNNESTALYPYALSGDDSFDLSDSGDNVRSYGGADVVQANGGNDWVDGGGGNDRIFGGLGADTIHGGVGADAIRGGGGSDRIYSGFGSDIVRGDGGADIFVYRSPAEAGSGVSRDVIADFEHDIDHIDLSGIDANTRQGDDQAFRFIGSGQFTGVAGQLRYVGGVLQADVNGDRSADFALSISDSPRLSAGDFIL